MRSDRRAQVPQGGGRDARQRARRLRVLHGTAPVGDNRPALHLGRPFPGSDGYRANGGPLSGIYCVFGTCLNLSGNVITGLVMSLLIPETPFPIPDR